MDKLKLVENTTTFKLVIPKNVEAKIRHLCSMVADVEWSGTLFYKVKGDFENGDLEAECLDILPMDIGVSTYTEFVDSPDIITFRAQHPELLQEGVYEGLVHSHNRMAAFFSVTDNATLTEEGTDRNHFLSLIVNNAGQYVARITRKVTRESKIKAHIESLSHTYFDTYNGNKVVLKDNELKSEDKEDTKVTSFIEYYNMEIDKHVVSDNFEELNQRLADIKANKARKLPPKASNYPLWENDATFNDYTLQHSTSHYLPKETKNYLSDYYSSECNIPELSEYAKDGARVLALKLLTGCITADENLLANLPYIIKNTDTRYRQALGKIEENGKASSVLSDWLDTYVEFIICGLYSEEDKKFLNKMATMSDEYIDDSAIHTERAHAVLDILSKWEESLKEDSIVFNTLYDCLEDQMYV